jgi:hypothetical protein
MMTGYLLTRVRRGIEFLGYQQWDDCRSTRLAKDCPLPKVSEKTAESIRSHTDYAKRVAWEFH